MVRKNLPILSSFLRFDRKCSELSPPLITKAGSAPDYYGDSLDVMFLQFPNDSLPFPMVFRHGSPSVSTISSGVAAVFPQCFPRFLF